MFTGLVEARGTLVRRVDRGREARLVVRGDLVDPPPPGRGAAPGRRDPIALGESIAVDGVCLTVDAIPEAGGPGPTTFEVDASSETLERTTLGSLAPGAPVNLERAVAVGSRLGGHIVSGHVDGVGKVVSVAPSGAALVVAFEAPRELARFIAPKGSICVSGVSLTVNRVSGSTFDVMLIPHTQTKTSLDALVVGSKVNLEVDVVARYVARLLDPSARDSAGASSDAEYLELLRTSGFA